MTPSSWFQKGLNIFSVQWQKDFTCAKQKTTLFLEQLYRSLPTTRTWERASKNSSPEKGSSDQENDINNYLSACDLLHQQKDRWGLRTVVQSRKKYLLPVFQIRIRIRIRFVSWIRIRIHNVDPDPAADKISSKSQNKFISFRIIWLILIFFYLTSFKF